MKFIRFTALLVVLAFTLNAQEHAAGIKFEHSAWKDILAKAKSEKKLVMLDAYTSWCGPCKWMAKNIFTREDVAALYNASFVNAKIDMEKGEGIEIARKYNVRAYPTFLFINGDGEIVHRLCGSMEAESFILRGKTAMDEKYNYAALRKNFKADPRNNAGPFFIAADAACDDVSAELADYLKLLNKEEIASPSNFNLLYNIITSFDDASFPYLHSNYSMLAGKYGNDTLDEKLLPIYETALTRAGAKRDMKKLEAVKTSYSVIKDPKKKSYLDDVAAFAAIDKTQDALKFYSKQADFVDRNLMASANGLNHYAWDFYENVTDRKLLERARSWAETAVKIENSYAINDTYAALLFKLGMKPEAKKVAENAIELAKKTGEDAKETEEMLKKIDMLK
ncbi:MAG: thioredoxin domain-containing protein [Bacteroidia bacterium]